MKGNLLVFFLKEVDMSLNCNDVTGVVANFMT